MSTTPNPTPAPTTYTPTIATPSIVSAPVAPVVVPAPAAPPIPAAPQGPMRYSTLCVWNKSSVVADAEAQAVCEALQVQISRDFAPVWRIDATVIFVPSTGTPVPTAWVIAVMDDTSQAGALGWHEVDAANKPQGFVFARTDAQYGLSWSVTLSHEALELLADPWAFSTAFIQTSDTAGYLAPVEVGDPVESDAMAVVINGVKLSNWVTPEYFNGSLAANSAKFDFGGHVTAPLTLAPGGYCSRFTVTAGSGWGQLNQKGEFVPGTDADDDNVRHRR